MSSRREFIGALGGLALRPFERTTEPQLVLYNGDILTVDAAHPRAQAVAIARDRFLAVGTNDDIRTLSTARTVRIDLGGKTVVPGFIDAHTHPCYAGLRHLRQVDCELPSIADILAALRKRAAETAPGKWVLAFKYDDTKTAERRPLSRLDLDAAVPGHPVRVEHRGGHTSYVNSLAFKMANVSDNTPDPPGGRFERDPSGGGLSGRVSESANDVFDTIIPSQYSRQDYRDAVTLIARMMSRTGVTSVHDAQGTTDDLRAYQDAYAAGELSLRVYCLVNYTHMDRLLAAGIRTGLGNEWVRVGAMKVTCDGSISERTARLSQPYVGRPDDFGILVMDEEELYTHARKAHDADWQIGVHANGDVAIDVTLRVYDRLQRERARRDPRFRIEHCTIVDDSLVERIRRQGVIPTPFSTYVYYHGEKMREYGADRLNQMFAVRSFLDAGVHVTLASDYPPGPFEPMMALQSMVTRTDSKGNPWGLRQRVGVEEALRVATLHGAYASFEEDLKGSIEPGKLADLVVLGRDPLREDPFSLIRVQVERTMVGGRWVFEA